MFVCVRACVRLVCVCVCLSLSVARGAVHRVLRFGGGRACAHVRARVLMSWCSHPRAPGAGCHTRAPATTCRWPLPERQSPPSWATCRWPHASARCPWPQVPLAARERQRALGHTSPPLATRECQGALGHRCPWPHASARCPWPYASASSPSWCGHLSARGAIPCTSRLTHDRDVPAPAQADMCARQGTVPCASSVLCCSCCVCVGDSLFALHVCCVCARGRACVCGGHTKCV